MYTFLNFFQQGVKYSTQISGHQVVLTKEEKMVNPKSLYISDLQIDYLNLENSVRNIEIEKFLNKGAVAVEDYTQPINDFRQKRKN